MATPFLRGRMKVNFLVMNSKTLYLKVTLRQGSWDRGFAVDRPVCRGCVGRDRQALRISPDRSAPRILSFLSLKKLIPRIIWYVTKKKRVTQQPPKKSMSFFIFDSSPNSLIKFSMNTCEGTGRKDSLRRKHRREIRLP
jgi:hypothetical protein